MDTNAPLPPSGRNFDVYRFVRVDDRSTREAAREFRISQTRVCQILDQVEAFLYATTADCGPEKRAVRLEIALAIAAERVNRLYKRAQELFESEEDTYQIIRETIPAGKPPRTIVTTRQTHFETRFMNAALKFAAARAKMPALYLDTLLGAEYDDDGYDDEATPAEEACSAGPAPTEITAATGLPTAIVTALQDAACVLPSPAAIQSNSAPSDSVQPLESAADRLQTCPTAADSPRPLSARDRAAREAFLTRAS